jgi:hypothetical protein
MVLSSFTISAVDFLFPCTFARSATTSFDTLARFSPQADCELFSPTDVDFKGVCWLNHFLYAFSKPGCEIFSPFVSLITVRTPTPPSLYRWNAICMILSVFLARLPALVDRRILKT